MRTQLNDWQIRARENENEMKYVHIPYQTVAHSPAEIVTYPVPFPADIKGINIKTIRIVSEESLNFVVSLMDGNTEDVIYESLDELGMQYDQVDIPYKPAEQKLFVRIHNKGSVATRFTIDVRGLEVK